MKEAKESLELLRSLAAANPHSGDIWTRYANHLFAEDGDPEEAILAHERAGQLTGRDARLRLAHFHALKGEAERAIQLAESSVRDRGMPVAYKILLQVLITFKLFDEAERRAEEARKKYPLEADFAYYWARAKARGKADLQGEHQAEVVAAYEAALRLNPTHAESAASLGAFYTFSGQVDRGLTLLRMATEWVPEDGWLWLKRAERLWHTGHRAEAARAFERALVSRDADSYFDELYKEFLAAGDR